MRIRTLLAFGSGLALGAGYVYLFDPDHGPTRRREAVDRARAAAAAEARRRAEELGDQLRAQASEVVRAARDGFGDGRVAG